MSAHTGVSPCVYVPSGEIQRSVIDPTLFGICNDIPNVIMSAKIQLYADDLKLWRSVRCVNDRSIQLDVQAQAVYS